VSGDGPPIGAPDGLRSRDLSLGVSRAIYRELEAGTRTPAWETFDRICKMFGWPQTFVTAPWYEAPSSAGNRLGLERWSG
jgi:DNA-binding XRE family transcriptional regulator